MSMNITEEMLRKYLIEAEKAHKSMKGTPQEWPDFYAAYIYTRIAIACSIELT